MSNRVSRPPFRRGLVYVAVRRLRLSSATVLEPGEMVDLPNHRLRRLLKRRRIGPKGHPWTEHWLARPDGFPTNSSTIPDAPPEGDDAPVNDSNDDAEPDGKADSEEE